MKKGHKTWIVRAWSNVDQKHLIGKSVVEAANRTAARRVAVGLEADGKIISVASGWSPQAGNHLTIHRA